MSIKYSHPLKEWESPCPYHFLLLGSHHHASYKLPSYSHTLCCPHWDNTLLIAPSEMLETSLHYAARFASLARLHKAFLDSNNFSYKHFFLSYLLTILRNPVSRYHIHECCSDVAALIYNHLKPL